VEGVAVTEGRWQHGFLNFESYIAKLLEEKLVFVLHEAPSTIVELCDACLEL
jgi:hypothetical protein